MNNIKYTISIRTTGRGGEKYRALLKSIDNLKIKPEEVHIILPEGYEPPKDRLGYEKILYSPKGMVKQRVYGAEVAKTEYILFIDDDVEFEPELIEKLAEPILEGKCDCSIPPQVSMLPPKGDIRQLILILLLRMIPTVFRKKEIYVKVMKSGGSIYNRLEFDNVPKYLSVESAPGIIFFIKKSAFLDMHYEEELWVEDTGYAYGDDLIMFYKLHLLGHKTICVTDAYALHLDAGGSSPERGEECQYATGRNCMIFWKKFIYNQQNNVWGRISATLMYKYYEIATTIFGKLRSFSGDQKKKEYIARKKGLKAGRKYINENKI